MGKSLVVMFFFNEGSKYLRPERIENKSCFLVDPFEPNVISSWLLRTCRWHKFHPRMMMISLVQTKITSPKWEFRRFLN